MKLPKSPRPKGHTPNASPSTRSSPVKSPAKGRATFTRSPAKAGSTARSPSLQFRSPSEVSPGKEKLSGDFIEITVNSVMEGVEEAKILVPASSKVADLKASVSEVTDVLPDKMVLLYKGTEIKGDDQPISAFGISEDCELVMSVKMSTGSKVARPSNAVLYVPPSFPEGSVTELRNKIRSMTTIRGNKPKVSNMSTTKRRRTPMETKYSQWTPEKQMEHELTRNRMKHLLKRKRKKLLSDSPPRSLGSVESASVMSPSPSNLSNESVKGKKKFERRCRTTVTESELKTFFEPSETILEVEQMKKDMSLPPSTEAERKTLKEVREKHLATVCKVCHAKLKPMEQQLPCACTHVFCKKHRKPEKHFCNVDHKQAGRFKIHRENPKVSDGGTRKAK